MYKYLDDFGQYGFTGVDYNPLYSNHRERQRNRRAMEARLYEVHDRATGGMPNDRANPLPRSNPTATADEITRTQEEIARITAPGAEFIDREDRSLLYEGSDESQRTVDVGRTEGTGSSDGHPPMRGSDSEGSEDRRSSEGVSDSDPEVSEGSATSCSECEEAEDWLRETRRLHLLGRHRNGKNKGSMGYGGPQGDLRNLRRENAMVRPLRRRSCGPPRRVRTRNDEHQHVQAHNGRIPDAGTDQGRNRALEPQDHRLHEQPTTPHVVAPSGRQGLRSDHATSEGVRVPGSERPGIRGLERFNPTTANPAKRRRT